MIKSGLCNPCVEHMLGNDLFMSYPFGAWKFDTKNAAIPE